jgi:hypothetical protein
MKTYKPALHEEFPMKSYVEINNRRNPIMRGIIRGIAQADVIFTYIVELDSPIETEFGVVECVVVPGVCLRLI